MEDAFKPHTGQLANKSESEHLYTIALVRQFNILMKFLARRLCVLLSDLVKANRLKHQIASLFLFVGFIGEIRVLALV
jgi:hypothetical protein